MFRSTLRPHLLLEQAQNPVRLIAVVIGNMVFNILSNVCFKYSANSTTVPQFLVWQVVGNLAGFITVITLTWLLKFVPLHVAFPVTTGLAIIGVHIIGSIFFFKEPVSNLQWLGTLVIILGIFLITG